MPVEHYCWLTLVLLHKTAVTHRGGGTSARMPYNRQEQPLNDVVAYVRVVGSQLTSDRHGESPALATCHNRLPTSISAA